MKRTLLKQLERNKTLYGMPPLWERGDVGFVFPFLEIAYVPAGNRRAMLDALCIRPPSTALARCPIFQALTREERDEVVLRGPKHSTLFVGRLKTLLIRGFDAYVASTIGGVSPITALALLIPEPRYEQRFGGFPPVLTVPDGIGGFDLDSRRWSRAHSMHWHIMVWSLKRYTSVSWRDLSAFGPPLQRRPTSLRETIRKLVEEPLKQFYFNRTGLILENDTVSAAIVDDWNAPAWSREKLRTLKRSAARSRRIPTK